MVDARDGAWIACEKAIVKALGLGDATHDPAGRNAVD